MKTTLRFGRFLTWIPLVLFLSGCGFKPNAWRPEKNGFGYRADFLLEEGPSCEGSASFHGSRDIDEALLDAYAHRAAAQACREGGFPYFAVTETRDLLGEGWEEKTIYKGSYYNSLTKKTMDKYETRKERRATKGRTLRFVALKEIPERHPRAVLSVERILSGSRPSDAVVQHPPLGEAGASAR